MQKKGLLPPYDGSAPSVPLLNDYPLPIAIWVPPINDSHFSWKSVYLLFTRSYFIGGFTALLDFKSFKILRVLIYNYLE
jgi:hypothetical protein